MNILSYQNAKTTKGEEIGVLTGILYLAPNNVSGYEVCPKATEGCKKACLYSSGRGAYQKVKNARIRKTKMFFEDRRVFMAYVVDDIEALLRKGGRENKKVAIRMNGTSDIAWEKISCNRDGKKYRNLMMAFPEVMFYDYTKIPNRKAAAKYPNYHLTFSLAENNENDAKKALKNGINVAVVVKMKKTDLKPITYNNIPVIDGDKNDVRFYDSKGGNLVFLTAKGKARYDDTGFVKSLNQTIIAKG